MSKPAGNIRQFELSSLSGLWSARFIPNVFFKVEHRDYGDLHERLFDLRVEDWLAWLPLRRSAPGGKGKKKQANVRAAAASVQFFHLTLRLPPSGNKERWLYLDLENAPPTEVILDHPYDQTTVDKQRHMHFLLTKSRFRLDIVDGKWPSWVEKAELVTGNTSKQVKPKDIIEDVFQLKPGSNTTAIEWCADSVVIEAARQVPWHNSQMLDGRFRCAWDDDPSALHPFQLSIAQDKAWQANLKRYQLAVIHATRFISYDRNKNDQEDDAIRMPDPLSPAVGVVSAHFPEEIIWYYHNEAAMWRFIPPAGLFELEMRGTAGGTSRLVPGRIAMAENGLALTFTAGNIEAEDAVQYHFEPAAKTNRWNAAFEAIPEPESIRHLRNSSRFEPIQEEPDELEEPSEEEIASDPGTAWIMTETGAMGLPLLPGKPPEQEIALPESQSFMKGLLRLSEIPWKSTEDNEPPMPQIGEVNQGSLLLLSATGFECTITLSEQTDEEEDERLMALDLATLQLADPQLRLEDFMPFFIPTTYREAATGPPLLQAVGEETAGTGRFFGMTFLKGLVPNPPSDALSWRFNLEFHPAADEAEQGENHYLEGDWGDSKISVNTPAQLSTLGRYWYKPRDLRWVPALPLSGDPAADPEHRVNQLRTFMPLVPQSLEQSIDFSFGQVWNALELRSGTFTIPPATEAENQHNLYRWVMLELPGLELELLHGEAIQIKKGLPAGGKLRWNWRHDLPVLDELFALRLGEQAGSGLSWPDQLATRDALAKISDPFLFRQQHSFHASGVFRADQLAVSLSGLFGQQHFEGLAAMNALEPSASLSLKQDSNAVPLIPNDRLLEGAGAAFTYQFPDNGPPVLTPVSEQGEYTWQLRAGTFVPATADGQWIDQRGRMNNRVQEGAHRQIHTNLGEGGYGPLFQWNAELNLHSQAVKCRLRCVGLPLTKTGDSWHFDRKALPADEVFHEFRWGFIGPVSLWGFDFQVFSLDLLDVRNGEGDQPDMPLSITLSGVLHYRDEHVRAADPDRQSVSITLSCDAHGQWQPTALSGHVLWPLFAEVPDLADAVTADLREPYPWVSASVELDDGRLKLAHPAIHFQYLERTWQRPLEDQSFEAGEEQTNLLTFLGKSQISDAEGHALVPYELTIQLARNQTDGQTTLTFKLAVDLPLASNALMDADLRVEMDAREVRENLERITLMRTDTSSMWNIPPGSFDVPVTYSFANGQLAFVLNRSVRPAKSVGAFRLLPGFIVSQREAAQAFVTIQLQKPTTEAVSQVKIEAAQVIIESTAQAEGDLKFRLSCSLDRAGTWAYELDFTGEWTLRNAISWPGEEAKPLEHEIAFLLRQARIPQDRLLEGERSFFELTLDEGHPWVEWPCFARHCVFPEGDEHHPLLRWTAPQRLRLFHPQTFCDEVLITGEEAIQGYDLHYGKTRKGSTLTVQHKFSLKPKQWDNLERGFSGALAAGLEKYLHKLPSNTIIAEASEAFWLWPNAGASDRPSVELWRLGARQTNGIPTGTQDFRAQAAPVDPEDHKTQATGWFRMAMPFFSGAGLNITRKMPAALRQMLANDPGKVEANVSTFQFLDPNTRISLPRLLRQEDLPRYSLDHPPAHPGPGRVFDQVFPAIEAYERIFPFTQPMHGFEPGWLVFAPWHLGKDSDPFSNMAFGLTKAMLDHLIQVQDKEKLLAAALEVYPTTREAEDLWKRVKTERNNPVPYLVASPLLDWQSEWNTTRMPEWKPISMEEKIEDEIARISSDLTGAVLEWINKADAATIDYRVLDGPGGYAPEGVGIGTTVAERIVAQCPAEGYASLLDLYAIKGLGVDKLNDLLWMAAPKPLRVLVEVWLPGISNPWTQEVEPVLVGREVSRLGKVKAGTPWEDLLFQPDTKAETTVPSRLQLWEWVHKQVESHRHRGPLLIRATRLEPHSELPERYYHLLKGEPQPVAAFSPLRKLSVAEPAMPDARLEKFTLRPDYLATLPGPDYLEGKVYYEPLAWSDPPELLTEERGNGEVIFALEAQPALVKRGEPVTLSWSIAEMENPPVLILREKDSEQERVVEGNTYAFYPRATAIYELIARDGDDVIDQREAVVRVQVPASGSGIGLAWKLSANAPGPSHGSRTAAGWQRWVEMSCDPVFDNLTLQRQGQSRGVLPPSRVVSWEASDRDPAEHSPLMPARAVQVQTSGRAGQWFDYRHALLLKDTEDVFRRQRSVPFSLRHPRPVPVPKDLQPTAINVTTPVEVEPPFRQSRIEWQDPMYNRRLLAVGQESVASELTLRLDRGQYAAMDIFYPHVIYKVNDIIGEGWKIAVTATIYREVQGNTIAMHEMAFELSADDLDCSATDADEKLQERSHRATAQQHQWVFELGLNQNEAADPIIAMAFEDQDRLSVTARLIDSAGHEKRVASLDAVIRTDIRAWPQPQNAFAIIRQVNHTKDVAAFGWNPKPLVVKREDRFDPGSWKGTFRYDDLFIHTGPDLVRYAIWPFTPYGEQIVNTSEEA